MDKKSCTGAMCIDLCKAFNTVIHSCLLIKLPQYGIKGIKLNWVTNYFSNRKQFVRLNQTSSDQLLINLGIPQGSLLDPC